MEKELTKLEVDCESIRKDIKECGKLYITVAYKVYELYTYGVYKEKYKNIVECCREEFGFKKSTVYNFLGIVDKFGEKENGIVTYRSLMKYDKFSYSQLSEMLSLSDGQRIKVTPDTTVSEIRKIKSEKKVQTSGKKVEDFKVSESEPEIIEVLPEQFQVEKVQTSGKIENNEKSPDSVSSENKEIEELKFKLKLAEDRAEDHWKSRERQAETIRKYRSQVEELKRKSEQLYKESENKLKNLLEQRDAFRERLLKDEETINSQSETISDYMKRNEKLIYRNSILETDNRILMIRVQQLEEKISQLEAEKKEQIS